MIAPRERRLGLLADVHGNLQALERVLEYLDGEGIDAVYCLGDVVGYGGDPAACVALVRERCAGTVQGNHDRAVVDAALRGWFNEHARAAIERQVELLGAEEREWLSALPPVLHLADLSLAHSGFVDPLAYTYVTSPIQAAAELESLTTRWGFLAHTHVPACFRLSPEGGVSSIPMRPGDLPLEAEGRYLVNPGAVGQPRDRDPRAACAIFDRATASLRLARLPYDVGGAQAAIVKRGLPSFEAARLSRGV